MLTLPTQEELDAFRKAADANWHALPLTVYRLLALIDAQNKRIAELLEDNKELHI